MARDRVGSLLFFVPGTVILWLSKRIPVETKVVLSVVVSALMICLVVALLVYDQLVQV